LANLKTTAGVRAGELRADYILGFHPGIGDDFGRTPTYSIYFAVASLSTFIIEKNLKKFVMQKLLPDLPFQSRNGPSRQKIPGLIANTSRKLFRCFQNKY
jgi:hypothetical protein